jgi:hypothetical protein
VAIDEHANRIVEVAVWLLANQNRHAESLFKRADHYQ